MGKKPTVLKMAIQIYHPGWLFRAAFHKAISFHTISKFGGICNAAEEHNRISNSTKKKNGNAIAAQQGYHSVKH
jgi:hypothetical protein